MQEHMTLEQYRIEMGLAPPQKNTGTKTGLMDESVFTPNHKIDPGGKQRPSKYGAKKTKVDGITFDSRAEAEYYIHLKHRMALGQISGFARQAEFILQDGDGTAIRYKADFVVWERWGDHFQMDKVEVHEVKGMELPGWKLKEKLFRAKYPSIQLRVIK